MSFGHKLVPCLWSVSSRRSLCSARSVLLFSFVIFSGGKVYWCRWLRFGVIREFIFVVVVSCVDMWVVIRLICPSLYLSCFFNFCPAIFLARVCLVDWELLFFKKNCSRFFVVICYDLNRVSGHKNYVESNNSSFSFWRQFVFACVKMFWRPLLFLVSIFFKNCCRLKSSSSFLLNFVFSSEILT